jgi:putative ABC transport system permease protein
MILNYIKVAWRNLLKNRTTSAINISGLAIGIASSVLLLGYVSFQLSYDRFNGPAIYRVNLDVFQDNRLVVQTVENYSAVGPALKKDFPEVVAQARL